MEAELYNLSPVLRLLLVGMLLAAGPLIWIGLRHRGMAALGRFRALTLVTL